MTKMRRLALCLFGMTLGLSSLALAQDGRNGVVPSEYRQQRYVYDGWRERGLPQPAAGQEWLHVCDSFILTSMRSGRVDQVHVVGQSRVDQKPDFRLADSFECLRGRGRGRPSLTAGDRLPSNYMQNRYIYYDWRDSGLSPPPRGYRWMIIDDQYVLAGSRTGVIAEIRDVSRHRD
jgi:Ni/Co efflux regulator RcnB